MENYDVHNSKSVKRFAKSLALLIVLFACGFATLLLLHFGYGFLEYKVFKLICVIASLTFIGLIVFFWKTKAIDDKSNQQIIEEIDERLKIMDSIIEKEKAEMDRLVKVTSTDLKQTGKILKKINSISKETVKKIEKQSKIIDNLRRKLGAN